MPHAHTGLVHGWLFGTLAKKLLCNAVSKHSGTDIDHIGFSIQGPKGV